MTEEQQGSSRNRDELIPIFVRSEIDDLGLTTNAFRVYGHLARRAGKDVAWPSYASIGVHCFRPSYPNAKESTLRRRAIEAVKELEEVGLIKVIKRRRENNEGHTSNHYRLLTIQEWRASGKSQRLANKESDNQTAPSEEGASNI